MFQVLDTLAGFSREMDKWLFFGRWSWCKSQLMDFYHVFHSFLWADSGCFEFNDLVFWQEQHDSFILPPYKVGREDTTFVCSVRLVLWWTLHETVILLF